MRSLLHLKHWQLFTIVCGVPIVFYIVMIMAIVTSAFDFSNRNDIQEMPSLIMIIFGGLFFLAAIASAIVLFIWMYTLATSLYDKLPAGHNMKIKRFKFAFYFPMGYIVLLIPVMIVIVTTQNPMLMLIIFPLHILAMICLVYVLYFVSRSMKSAELQRTNINFGDYAGEFFLMWFYMIGIWYLQPRINQMFSTDTISTTGLPIDRSTNL